MNHYAPRQLHNGRGGGRGIWHFTCRNDDAVFPVGYCAVDCPGHSSPDGARRHFRDYLLDERLSLDEAIVNEQRRCAVCDDWTQGRARILPPGGDEWILCDRHRTRDIVERLFRRVGDAVSSW